MLQNGYPIETVTYLDNPADGDGNGDGRIDINDALMAAKYDVMILGEDEISRFDMLDDDFTYKMNGDKLSAFCCGISK